MAAVGMIYTSEISHAQFRSMLLTLGTVDASLGILIVTIVGVYLEWHTAAVTYGFLALISLILSFFVPESPHWLANFTDASNTKIKAQMKYLYSAEWVRITSIYNK